MNNQIIIYDKPMMRVFNSLNIYQGSTIEILSNCSYVGIWLFMES